MTQEKLYIVIPAFNEEENIQKSVEEWYKIIDITGASSRLIVANDGSFDKTGKILQNLENIYPKLTVLNKENSGYDATVKELYQYALNEKADYIFQTDSDLQTTSKDFQKFWDLKDNKKIVIGMRKRKDKITRRFISFALNTILSLIFLKKVPDANTPFRLIERSFLQKYIDFLPSENIFGFGLSGAILTVCAIYKKENHMFLPVDFYKPQGKDGGIKFNKLLTITKNTLKYFIKLKKELDKIK